MKFKMDFNLQAWIQGIEIEAISEEEAKEKLARMSVEDIISEGYVKDNDIDSVDATVVSKTISVKATDIQYDFEEVLEDGVSVDKLISEISVSDIEVDATEDEDEQIKDNIEMEVYHIAGLFPTSFEYTITEVK